MSLPPLRVLLAPGERDRIGVLDGSGAPDGPAGSGGLDAGGSARPGAPGATLAPDDEAGLARLYAYPPGPTVRLNVVSTLDGAAAGADGLSGSINTPADHRVFAVLRALSDAVVVGAGTARAEGYGRALVPDRLAFLRAGRPAAPTLVVVTASGDLPDDLLDGVGGPLLVATTSGCPRLARLRARLGAESVLALGGRPAPRAAETAAPPDAADIHVDALLAALADRGLSRVLCEGGPRLAGAFAAEGRLDEWCGTFVPRVTGGGLPDGPGRVLAGPALDVSAELVGLLEGDGTLLGRWRLPSAV